MDQKTKHKLERYFINTDRDRFLWGVFEGNQKKVYDILSKKYGFPSYDFPYRVRYAVVERKLLDNPGIERIIRDIVVPEIKTIYKDDALNYLRDCWRNGIWPEYEIINKLCGIETTNGVVKRFPQHFVRINSYYKHVEGWTVFAGLWFEEIEPLQDKL